jgi:hypothetical protein
LPVAGSEIRLPLSTDSLRSLQNRTADLADGRTELADLARSRRHCDPGNDDAVRDLIESERFLSHKQIGHMFGLHQDAAKRILRDDLQMRKVNCKWILHTLSSSQKASRVQVSKDLFQASKAHQIENCALSPLVMIPGSRWIIHGWICGLGPRLQGQLCLGAQLELKSACCGSSFPGLLSGRW